MNVNYLKAVYILLAFSTALLGGSMILIGANKQITNVVDFYSLGALFPAAVFNTIAALAFLITALLSLFSLRSAKFQKPLAYLILLTALVPLLALFSKGMWIESLGGFPAIGSGQGVIKYFALASIGLLLLCKNMGETQKKLLAAFPVILVLLWIGGMKFTEIEAKGIEDLVATSPFMFWMYKLWDVQTTSNLIGVYDLVAAALVLASVFNARFFWPGALMSGAVFVVTQTFLFTFEGSLSPQTGLTGTGHFLIKDLWFLANLLFLWALCNNNSSSNR